MATAKELVSKSMETGPSTTIKAGSINLRTESMKLQASKDAEANALEVPVGGVKYVTNGLHGFNCDEVSFTTATYVTTDKEEQAVLDSAVKRQLLSIMEDKRK